MKLRWLLLRRKAMTNISSVQFSRSVVSDSLWPHESQHAQASLSITNSRSSLKLMSIESAAVTIYSDFGAQEKKVSHYFHCFPTYLPWSDGTVCHYQSLSHVQFLTNIDSILKSKGITLPTKVHLVKAVLFSVVMYGCERWTIKKAEHWCFRSVAKL